jgi:predicted acylesterase/phospholipase RssA
MSTTPVDGWLRQIIRISTGGIAELCGVVRIPICHYNRGRMGKAYRLRAIAILLSLATGCTYVNEPLSSGALPTEKRGGNRTLAETFTNVKAVAQETGEESIKERQITPTTKHAPIMGDTNGDGYFVGLAISGGGSRSANFGAACMFELQRIGLLQRVDYISSVSGGSLVGAYYCLNRQGWNPKNVQEKMTHSFASDIAWQWILPWDLIALMFTDYDRSDLLANTLRVNLYTKSDGKEQTFADLLPDRPRLLINATDLQSGRRFVFCNESFNEINSDLSKYPIAYAVAASSSVPVVLHQVTLRDFSTTFKQYRHLVDGGVVDNLGIATLVETYRAQVEAAQLQHLPDPYPHGAVFIVLDARVPFDPKVSSEGDPGFFASLKAAAGLSTTSMVSRASTATLDDVVLRNAPDNATAKQIRDAIDRLNKEGYVELDNVNGHSIRVADFSLSQIDALHQLPFSGFRDSVNSISTYFNITPQEAYDLYLAAQLLMKDRFESKLTAIAKEISSSQ